MPSSLRGQKDTEHASEKEKERKPSIFITRVNTKGYQNGTIDKTKASRANMSGMKGRI